MLHFSPGARVHHFRNVPLDVMIEGELLCAVYWRFERWLINSSRLTTPLSFAPWWAERKCQSAWSKQVASGCSGLISIGKLHAAALWWIPITWIREQQQQSQAQLRGERKVSRGNMDSEDIQISSLYRFHIARLSSLANSQKTVGVLLCVTFVPFKQDWQELIVNVFESDVISENRSSTCLTYYMWSVHPAEGRCWTLGVRVTWGLLRGPSGSWWWRSGGGWVGEGQENVLPGRFFPLDHGCWPWMWFQI